MMQTNIWDLEKHIRLVWGAHDKKASVRKNRVRLWDERTPYAMHPIWCATTLLTETKIEERLRFDGAIALLYHDILEDTSAKLKVELSPNIVEWVGQMTFHGGFEQEQKELFTRLKEVRLLKLYDKTSNIMDGVWMPPKLREDYFALTAKLVKDVRQNFGELNIVRIAETILLK